MIRILFFFILLAAAAFGFSWLADRPGEIVLTWQGQQIQTSLMVALGAVAVLVIALLILWSILRFVFRIPAIMSITARARRNNKGYAAISKGMVAAAIGDARATEKAAREASRHLGDIPLASLLQAQAAQISGNRDKAISTFNKMLENPETKVLGLRGLHLEAKRNGDSAAAQVFAKEAYSLAPLPWAGQALLDHNAIAHDWSAALAVVESSIARKAVGKAEGNRQRGVLKTGIAMDLSGREPDEALRIAREAIKLAPDLIPAYVVAGRLLARKGDIRRGGRLLEDGWRVAPHPELARAYLDLRPGDSATDRLSRARSLTKVFADHPESRLTLSRAALEARDFDLVRKTMEPLITAKDGQRMTVRACLLMADLEETQHGASGQVREWLARATRAQRDPMWIADGISTDTWAPASPVTGKLDAFVWDTPVERLSAPITPAQERKVEVLPPIAPDTKKNDSRDKSASETASASAAANATAVVAASAASAQKPASAAASDVPAGKEIGKEIGKESAKDTAKNTVKNTGGDTGSGNKDAGKAAAAASAAGTETKPVASASGSAVSGEKPDSKAGADKKSADRETLGSGPKEEEKPPITADKGAAQSVSTTSSDGKEPASANAAKSSPAAPVSTPATPVASGSKPPDAAGADKNAAIKTGAGDKTPDGSKTGKIPAGPPDDPGPRKPT